MKTATTLLLAAALLGGCAPYPEYDRLAADDPSAPEWVRDPALQARVAATVRASAAAWGDEHGADGWEVVLVEGLTYQGRPMNGYAVDGTIYINVTAADPCVETTALWHEVGHTVVGYSHDDARWSDHGFCEDVSLDLAAIVPASDPYCASLLDAPGYAACMYDAD